MSSDKPFVQSWLLDLWAFHQGISEDLRQDYIQMGCPILSGPIQHRCSTEVASTGISDSCSWWLILRSCHFWAVLHISLDLRGLSGQRPPTKTHWIPIFWPAPDEAVPAESVNIFVWQHKPFLLAKKIFTMLKGAEHHNWMISRCNQCVAIITGELRMQSNVEVVANIVVMWPLIVSYTKKTCNKTWWHKLGGVKHYWFFSNLVVSRCSLFLSVPEDIKWLILLFWRDHEDEIQSFPLFHIGLKICKYDFCVSSSAPSLYWFLRITSKSLLGEMQHYSWLFLF